MCFHAGFDPELALFVPPQRALVSLYVWQEEVDAHLSIDIIAVRRIALWRSRLLRGVSLMRPQARERESLPGPPTKEVVH
jgi:hypothetical protein